MRRISMRGMWAVVSLVRRRIGIAILIGAAVYGPRLSPLVDAATGREPMRAVEAVRAEFEHTGMVTATFSPDGRRVLTYSFGELSADTMIVWDAVTAMPLWTVKQRVDLVAFDRDSRTVVTIGSDGRWDSKTAISYWDLDSGRKCRSMAAVRELEAGVRCFGDSGRRLFVAVESGTLQHPETLVVCRDTGSLAALWTVAIRRCSPERIAVSADGTRLAIATSDGGCTLVDAVDGRKVFDLTCCTKHETESGNGIWSLAISPSGDAIAAGLGDGSLAVWTGGGSAFRRWRCHSGMVGSVAFAPDGRALATAGDDCRVVIWNSRNEEQIRVFEEPSPVSSVAFSPSGNDVLAGTDNGSATVWNAPTGRAIKLLGLNTGAANCAAFSADGNAIIAGYSAGLALLWNARTGKIDRTFVSRGLSVDAVAFNPRETTVLAACGVPVANTFAQAILWDSKTGRQVRLFPAEKGDWAIPSGSVGFGPDGSVALVSRGIWSLRSGARLGSFQKFPARCAQFAPGGKEAVFGGGDLIGRLTLCNPLTGEERVSFGGDSGSLPACAFIRSVAISNDGGHVLVGSESGITIWNARTGRLERALAESADCSAVAFSPDGRLALSGSRLDSTVVLWDATTGRRLRVLKGHRAGVNGVAFHPDGTTAVSAGSDKRLIVWDLSTGASLRVLSAVIVADGCHCPRSLENRSGEGGSP